MAELLRGKGPRILGRVEITRSFSYKLNVGNFESRDFFMSQKAECAPSDAAELSEALHQFCKSQVMKAVNDYMAVDQVRKTAIESTKRRAS